MSRTIAYLAATFPSRNETFVYREVRELRRRGWTVHASTLHAPSVAPGAGFEDLEADLLVVYDTGWTATALAELLWHPLRSLATLALGLRDALAPGEPTGAFARAKGIAQSLAGLALARRLRPRGVTHLHCHFAHSPASVGMYAAAQLGVAWSFTGHANDIFQRRSLLRRKLQRAAFVACISEWHRALYRDIAPDSAGRCALIRCGVDVTRWKPEPRAAREGPLRVATVCRLVEKKGVDVLIRAVAGAQRELALTIAGDGPERASLEALATQLGCADRVAWLGALDNERILPLLRETDVFALPCRTDRHGDRDGIPVVLMEAMACGLAVIAGDVPAIHELIEHEVDGLFVAENDHAALAARLDALTPERRDALGRAARAKVEAEYSLAGNATRLERALGA